MREPSIYVLLRVVNTDRESVHSSQPPEYTLSVSHITDEHNLSRPLLNETASTVLSPGRQPTASKQASQPPV